jgi:hypothetical protein
MIGAVDRHSGRQSLAAWGVNTVITDLSELLSSPASRAGRR